MNWILLALMVAGSFWEDKPPAQWTDPEISAFLSDSPWAQIVGAPAKGMPAPPAQIFLATAPTVAAAEKEHARRVKIRQKATEKEVDTMAEELAVWMEENSKTQVVLAVKLASNAAFSNGGEVRKMEDDSYMQLGRSKVKMTGYFPPTKSDPYLRIAFPRPEVGEEKNLIFSIYVPGLTIPYREVVFHLKDMVLKGQLEL